MKERRNGTSILETFPCVTSSQNSKGVMDHGASGWADPPALRSTAENDEQGQ